MAMIATVRVRSARGTHTETVEASVLATPDALVDMAPQAGVSGTEFITGEVIA